MKNAALHKIPFSTEKIVLLSIIGALNFYKTFIGKLHINLKRLYYFSHKNTPWNLTPDHERIFQQIKTALSCENELTIPTTKHPFFITVDVSVIGLDAVIFQLNEVIKTEVNSYNSRILKRQEKNTSHSTVNFSVFYTLYKFMRSSILNLHIQPIFH